MKLVGVSQRVDVFPERNEMRDALDQRLTQWLLSCGFVAVPIPNTLGADIIKWLMVLKPAALVLSGGNDIGKCPDRDATEVALLSYARDHVLPVLGICRGMQMMGHWYGVELHPVNGHVGTRHKITGQITSEVNSYHQFSLSNATSNFKVIARSEDSEIEAIRHVSLPWEGWMWHPEREQFFSQQDIIRLKLLFK